MSMPNTLTVSAPRKLTYSQPAEPKDIKAAFGVTIRKWRKERGLSQESLANRASLHRTYVCDVERGARNVSLDCIQRLADALQIPIAQLFPPDVVV